MKAIAAYHQSPQSTDQTVLRDITLPLPTASGHDLLVEVKAISVNPVDCKVRQRLPADQQKPKILGWDASGIVKEVGELVTLFKPGDRVWYAGAIDRDGTDSEYHLVDERIVGKMPKSLGFAEAAAMPLTTITAWELLFDRLGLRQGKKHEDEKLMVIGAAGGVGSILLQLARQLTGITVIATASREKTRNWVKDLGAHFVIDHSKPLSQELHAQNLGEVDYVISLNQTDQHLDEIIASLKPQGKLALIDDPDLFDVRKLKSKSLSLHWEFMFTKPLFKTTDQVVQHLLLDTVADLVDSGKIRTTLAEHFGVINAENLQRAHELLESGKSTGKIVLENFS